VLAGRDRASLGPRWAEGYRTTGSQKPNRQLRTKTSGLFPNIPLLRVISQLLRE